MTSPARETKTGIELRVRLTPKAAHDRVDELKFDGNGASYVAARVRAVPEKGKANAALARLVAEWLGVPQSTVEIVTGTTGRLKTVAVTGEPGDLAARVARLIAPAKS